MARKEFFNLYTNAQTGMLKDQPEITGIKETGRDIYNMGFRSSATLKGASVLLLISSTVTPSAISTRVKPVAKSTLNTPYSWSAFHARKEKEE